MIYIIDGQEELFIRQKLKQIISNNNDVIKFDGNNIDFDVNEMLIACNGNSLFSSSNIILVKDAPFLIKKFDEKQLEKIMDYVNNPIYETELVFYSLENKHNSKLKAYKDISKNANVIKCENLDYKNFNTYVNQQVNINKLNISLDAINLLNTICKRSATLLNKNIEILLNYPGRIDVKVVEKLCTASDDNDSFELINAITDKNISKVIFLERKMLKENDSIISVIGLLASQLRFLYQISYLNSIGKNKSEIIEETKCNEYRLSKAMITLRKLDGKRILHLLDKLSILDISLKNSNDINDSTRFELFVLELLRG